MKETPIMVPGLCLFIGNQKGKIVGIGKIGFRHNLLSISQLCDNEYDIFFNKGECIVKNFDGSLLSNKSKCNLSSVYKRTWHKKLGHASLRLISKLNKHNLIKGLPSLVYKADLCVILVRKGNKLEDPLGPKTLFQLLDLWSNFTLICLVQLELPP
ncbi:hypothetical protein CR513_40620, partial [Mucuna pruriens]